MLADDNMVLRGRSFFAACVFAFSVSHLPSAHADVLLRLIRLTDTTAILSASGHLGSLPGTLGNFHTLQLEDPFGVDPGGFQNSWVLGSYTTLRASSASRTALLDFAYNAGGGFTSWGFTGDIPHLYFGDSSGTYIPEDSTVSGSMEVVLSDGTTFSPAGATGRVSWGDGVFPENIVGTWEIVAPLAVPEPATFALVGAALAGVAATRRRKPTTANC